MLVEGVKRLRVEQGMTQAELAEQMSHLGFRFHQATVYKIENGERRVSASECYGLARVFDVEIDELFHRDQSPEAHGRHIRTVADRMTQAILALDEICLRIRVIQRSMFQHPRLGDSTKMKTLDGQEVTTEGYLEPLRAFYLHNEILTRLRTEVWADQRFANVFADVSGIRELAPLERATEAHYERFDQSSEVDPIDLMRTDDDRG